jgi:putative colanic acid biosynthesis acetyltransferase WcaF
VQDQSTADPDLDPNARHRSPWTLRQKFGRFLWGWVERTLFRWSPQPFYSWRAWLLRLFGACIASPAYIRATVTIAIPGNLTIGAHTAIGDHAILYCLGPITLGERVTVSQYAHLCAGTHDYTRPDMPLLRPPILIEDDVWVAAEAFIGPGVRIGQGAVVGARSCVFRDLPPWMVCVGNPARPVKKRVYQALGPAH